eukprot:COSAG01_NODE_11056_length_2018_cov_1.075000_2_plen_238_part_00
MGDLRAWLCSVHQTCEGLLEPLDDEYGVKEVEELLLLDPEHVEQLCDLLKVVPAKKFRRALESIAAGPDRALSEAGSSPTLWPTSPGLCDGGGGVQQARFMHASPPTGGVGRGALTPDTLRGPGPGGAGQDSGRGCCGPELCPGVPITEGEHRSTDHEVGAVARRGGPAADRGWSVAAAAQADHVDGQRSGCCVCHVWCCGGGGGGYVVSSGGRGGGGGWDGGEWSVSASTSHDARS